MLSNDDLEIGESEFFPFLRTLFEKDPEKRPSIETILRAFYEEQPFDNKTVTTIRHFLVGKFIGSGHFGKAYIAFNKNAKQKVCLKEIDFKNLSKEQQTKLQKQAELISSLHHPNIRLIVFALKYLHSKQILHRDLKPDNILISKHFTIKISDFGLSKITSDNTPPSQSSYGLLKYSAPELLSCLPNSDKSDVWSMGCIFYELLFHKFPFSNEDDESIIYTVLTNNPTIQDCKYSPILHQIFQKKPENRASIHTISEFLLTI
jgi:serine/threonine protein kinase